MRVITFNELMDMRRAGKLIIYEEMDKSGNVLRIMSPSRERSGLIIHSEFAKGTLATRMHMKSILGKKAYLSRRHGFPAYICDAYIVPEWMLVKEPDDEGDTNNE